jgi:hypothetical protein
MQPDTDHPFGTAQTACRAAATCHQADLARHFLADVTIRDMSRRWPYADWRRHAERAGGSVSVAEAPQRTGMQQPALARSRKMLPPGVA